MRVPINLNQLLKAPFVKTFHVIKNQTGSYDFEGLEVRLANHIDQKLLITNLHNLDKVLIVAMEKTFSVSFNIWQNL